MKRIMFGLGVAAALTAATATNAWAGWGCGSQGTGAQGRTWNFATQAQASQGALDECTRAGGQACEIIGCSDNVDNEAQADAIWRPAGADTVKCGQSGQPKC
jgi:hypothetical protein